MARKRLRQESSAASSEADIKVTLDVESTKDDTIQPSVDLESLRRSRSAEKELLKTITKRLDYYILTQRERDAAQGNQRQDLTSICKKAKDDLDDLRATTEKQQKESLAKEQKILTELAYHKDITDRLHRQIAQLEEDIKRKTEDAESYESQLKSKLNHASTMNKDLVTLKVENDALKRNSENKQKEYDDMVARLAKAQKDLQVERLARLEIESKSKKTEANLSRELDLARAQVTLLTDERDAWTEETNRIRQTLQDEYVAKMNKFLKEQELRKEKEIDQLSLNLRKRLRETEESTEVIIQSLTNSKLKSEEELLEAKTSIQNLTIRLTDSNRAQEALKKEVSSVRDELNDQIQLLRDELVEKTRAAQNAEERYVAKTREFDALIDVKLLLLAEIRRYHDLMLTVEDFDEQFNETSSGAAAAATTTARVVSTYMDPKSCEIIFKNSTTETLNLDTWALASKNNRKEYTFSNIMVKSGETFKIYFGEDATQRVSQSRGKAIVLAVKNILVKNDTAILYDNRGIEVCRVEIK